MYEFSSVTPRIQALREKIRNRIIPKDLFRKKEKGEKA